MISAFSLPCVSWAALRGSQSWYIWSIISWMMPYVEYLHSMILICFPPRYCGVRDETPLRVCGVTYGPDEVRAVVFRLVLWVEYIVWYGLMVAGGVLFVILEHLLAWMGDGL